MDSVAGFITAAAGAAFLANLIVGGIKKAVDLPRWAPVLLAYLAATGGQFLLLITEGAIFTTPIIAKAIVIGLIAWGLSIGLVEVQRKGDKVDEKIDTALAMERGSTRAELEKVVSGTGDGK